MSDYRAAASACKSGWTLVRQLRGPHLRTWPWWRRAVEERGDRGGIAQQLAPVLDGAIGRDERGGALVAAHDDLEEVLGGGGRELAHAEVVDDEQRDSGELGEVLLAVAIEDSVGDLVEQDVCLAVEDAVALADGGAADGLGEVALAGRGGY